MKQPVISIIVPVYKVEKYLERCVNSILAQTFLDFDLILIDDGSPDRCGSICEKYAENDSRVHVIHRENGGLSAARNSGIEWTLMNSESEYLTFIDSDDWVHPQYLETLIDTARRYSVSVSICSHRRIKAYNDNMMKLFGGFANIEIMCAEELLINYEWNFNYAWGKLYKKEALKKIRYPEGKNFEDTFTTYKILFAEKRVALINWELYFYFENDAGISRIPWSPKELVIFEGMQNQMMFYQENGYDKAFEKEKQLYINHFAYQICRIRNNKKELHKNKYYIKLLRKKMLQLMRENPKQYGFRKMPQCYEAAYPHLMGIYHFVGMILRKLRLHV